jgi:hypothetical protein
LRAWVKTPWNTSARMDLSDRDGLRSHLDAAPEFDSTVEENFARKWGGIREGWQLKREAAILHQGQTTFVPDFLFRHDDGTEAHLEIVGYWTPEYLAAKRKTLRRFGDHNVLLAVAERSLKKRGELPPNIIPYKKALKIGPVLTALERMRRAC